MAWTSPEIADYYAHCAPLQKPEAAILSALRDTLREMRILDIGVGGGRTTRYLAPLAKEYFAIDYSETMIERCRRQFAGSVPPERFLTADAAALEQTFSDTKFDFILFSFNGIDYADYEERTLILREIRGRLRQGGYFAFSTHNLQAVHRWKKLHLSWDPATLLRALHTHRKRLRLNKEQIERAHHAEHIYLNDDAHDFALTTCYIRPQTQARELQRVGFRDIRLWDHEGRELGDADAIARCTDSWVYYLCCS